METAYTYNALNRLADMQVKKGTTDLARYTYTLGPSGNRLSRTSGGVTTEFLVDTLNPTGYSQVLEEIENGAVVHSYTYGLDLISQNQASGVSFYGYDGHGSVRLLTDASGGGVTDRYD